MSEAWVDDDPQTAMLLTQQEREDVAHMLRYYADDLENVDTPDQSRRRALALRIIQAAD